MLFFFNKWSYVQNNNSYDGKIVNMATIYVSDLENSRYGEGLYPRVEYYTHPDNFLV